MQQIARMRVRGLADAVIASAVGLTPPGLSRIIALPEYKDLEQSILDGVCSQMDQALAGNAEAMRREFKVGVPLAMRALLDGVMQRRDLKASMIAAREILDRDPDRVFAKQSDSVSAAQPGLSNEQIAEIAAKADKVVKETVVQ